MHHAYLNIAQNTVYEFYSTLSHRAGVVGNFSLKSVQVQFDSDLSELFSCLRLNALYAFNLREKVQICKEKMTKKSTKCRR